MSPAPASTGQAARRRVTLRAPLNRWWMYALAGLLAFWLPCASAQSSRDTERRLENIKRELDTVAQERRRIEDARGDASRQLRQADEKVGRSSRQLRETEAQLRQDQQALRQLQEQQATTTAALAAQREELGRLLRAAHAQGQAAPLKALLAQDRVAEANQTLAYQRYLQSDLVRRIDALSAQLQQARTLEASIAARQQELDVLRERQRQQLAELQRDRKTRASLMAQLDKRYQDRRSREQALGRDAQGLERLLARLRAAAARAEAERRSAAAKAARSAKAATATGSAKAATRPATPKALSQVGGPGWPLTGALLAGYGGTMPDGRGSHGLLIAANAGAPVKAVADGTVVYAEWMTGYGLLLILDHGNGYMSLYAHNDALLKEAGTAVKRGEAIATVGSSGGHGRPALYFELRREGQPVNPQAWLRR